MKKALVAIVIAIIALVGIAMACRYWFKWGPRPDIHVRGQVIDRDSGHGVTDAFVILAMQTYASSYGGTHIGCANGSAVVRTDKEGNFTYSITAREAFGPENPSSWSVKIYVYHPQFDAGVRVGMEEQARQFLAARQNRDGGWLKRPFDVYMTFPVFYNKDAGWATVEVVKRSESEWDQIDYFTSSPHSKCISAPAERGHLGLLAKMHERAWTLYCSSSGGNGGSSDPDNISAASAYFQFSAIKDAYLYDAGAAISQEQREGIAAAEEYVVRSILSEIPWNEEDESYARAMTHPERREFCALYQPPLEEFLRKRPAQ